MPMDIFSDIERLNRLQLFFKGEGVEIKINDKSIVFKRIENKEVQSIRYAIDNLIEANYELFS